VPHPKQVWLRHWRKCNDILMKYSYLILFLFHSFIFRRQAVISIVINRNGFDATRRLSFHIDPSFRCHNHAADRNFSARHTSVRGVTGYDWKRLQLQPPIEKAGRHSSILASLTGPWVGRRQAPCRALH